jgi:hypothetical protein
LEHDVVVGLVNALERQHPVVDPRRLGELDAQVAGAGVDDQPVVSVVDDYRLAGVGRDEFEAAARRRPGLLGRAVGLGAEFHDDHRRDGDDHHGGVDREDPTAGIRARDAQDGPRDGADGGRERRANGQTRLVDDFGVGRPELGLGRRGRRRPACRAPDRSPFLSNAVVIDVVHR